MNPIGCGKLACRLQDAMIGAQWHRHKRGLLIHENIPGMTVPPKSVSFS